MWQALQVLAKIFSPGARLMLAGAPPAELLPGELLLDELVLVFVDELEVLVDEVLVDELLVELPGVVLAVGCAGAFSE